MKKRLAVIVGPTAVGKSRLAVDLALELGGEIINADSRQVYRYMDIGTAKPGAAEQAAVPHHLLDLVNPDEPFNLALYRRKSLQAIDDIFSRGKLPILVGGTGQYVWATVEGWVVPAVAPDLELRKSLEEQAAQLGHLALYQQLVEEDPDTARVIDPRNVRRVVRALEVCRGAGQPFSRLRRKVEPPFDSIILGLTMPRSDLYGRIDRRVESMMENGLVDEVRRLHGMGFGVDLAPMTGIGYMEISSYLANQVDLESAVEKTKYRTHHLARRQYAWFNLKDTRIRWLTADKSSMKSASSLLKEFVGKDSGIH